jgi:FHA domain-containing protein/type VI secretion system protein
MDVLRARAVAKSEFQIESTVMLERDNNPLKFFPDVDMALAQMFGRPLRGYLPPTAAIRGAFNDLKAHEVATLAGMQGAVQGVIARFDPAAIEQRLGDKGGLSSVLPGQRKARLWDALSDQHQQLARAAGDDFQRVFGEAFAKAYRAQLEQLRHSPPR